MFGYPKLRIIYGAESCSIAGAKLTPPSNPQAVIYVIAERGV